MRVLVDTNVALDLLLDRSPHVEAAQALWRYGEAGKIRLHVAGVTPVNIFYIARKMTDVDTAWLLTQKLLDSAQVCPLTSEVRSASLRRLSNDFEDAVQIASAQAADLDAIVTRDRRGFVDSPLPVYSPLALILFLGLA